MNPTTTLHAHAPHVYPFASDRFDALRRDRMMVGSVLRYVRTLARIGRLADRADEVEKQVEAAIEAMGRIALETIQLEAESQPQARTLLDDGPDFEDAADWPAYSPELDDERWTTDEPTPDHVLSAEYEEWSDGLTFADHAAEIAEGVELDSRRLTDEDVRISAGCC